MKLTVRNWIRLLALILVCAIVYGTVCFVSTPIVHEMTIDAFVDWLATGFGLGYLPLLPGTAGALGGIMLSVVISRWRRWTQVLAVVALVGLAVPVCEYNSIHYEGGDDSRIVADELLTFPVATLALPIRHHPALLACVFITSRVFDGLKPPPARAAELLPGGLGIVLDDVVANAWALLLGLIGWRWYRRLLTSGARH